MKRTSILIPLALVLGLILNSCLDDRDTRLWKSGNESFMASLQDSIGLHPLEYRDSVLAAEKGGTYQPSAPSGIYYRELKAGTGRLPLMGESVTVAYTGWLYDGTLFDQGKLTFKLGTTVVDGFTASLQRMHVGDVWRVYIPYNLGYGTTENVGSSIPAYSTLVFKLELRSIN